MKLRTARPEERQLALLWLAAAVSAVVLRPVWLALAPNLRPCVFRQIAGFPCPSCGTTRAAVAMLSGDLSASLASNPLAAAAGLAFVAGAPLAALWAVARGPMLELGNPLPRWIRWALAFGILGNWAYLVLAT